MIKFNKILTIFSLIIFSIFILGCDQSDSKNLKDGEYHAVQIIQGANPQSYWTTELDIEIENNTLIYNNDNIGELSYLSEDISGIFDVPLSYLSNYNDDSQDLIEELKNIDGYYCAETPDFIFSTKVYILNIDNNIYMVLVNIGTGNTEMMKAIFQFEKYC